MPHPPQPGPTVPGERLHYMDAARAMLMFLGIPYHAAAMYAPAPNPWQVTVPQQDPAIFFAAEFLHSFRMPAFFLIAGFFATLLLERLAPGRWLRDRFLRLGILLLTCTLLLNPLQMVVVAHHQADGPAAWDRFRDLAGHFDAQWIQHAWFLVDLILLSVLAVGVWHVRHRLAMPARLATACLAWPLLLALAFAVARLFVKVLYQLAGNPGEFPGGLLSLERLLLFAMPFLLGMLLARRPALLAQSLRPGPATIALALLAGGLAALSAGMPGMPAKVAYNAFAGVAAILLSLLALSLAHRFMNTASRGIRFLADGAVAVYLLHLLVINALAAAVLPLGLPPLLVWAGVTLATAAICTAAYGLLIRRSTLLTWLFTGTPRRRPAVTPRGAPAGAASPAPARASSR